MVIRLGHSDEEVAEDQVMVKSTGYWLYKNGKSMGWTTRSPRSN